MSHQPNHTHVLLKDIVIPAGTLIGPAPIKRELAPGHGEILVSMTPDNTASLVLFVDGDELRGVVAPLRTHVVFEE